MIIYEYCMASIPEIRYNMHSKLELISRQGREGWKFIDQTSEGINGECFFFERKINEVGVLTYEPE